MKILESVFIYTFIAIGVTIYQVMKVLHETFGTVVNIDMAETPRETSIAAKPRPAF